MARDLTGLERLAYADWNLRWPSWTPDDYTGWTVWVCPLCGDTMSEDDESPPTCQGPMGAGAHGEVRCIPFRPAPMDPRP